MMRAIALAELVAILIALIALRRMYADVYRGVNVRASLRAFFSRRPRSSVWE